MPTQQEGIYYDCSDCTCPFLAMVFLQPRPSATASQVGAALGEVWSMYQDLKAGKVRDLPGHPPTPAQLDVLLGYGTDVFGLNGSSRPLPEALGEHRFPRPEHLADTPILANSGLAYASDLTGNVADAAIVVQLTGGTQLAVYRAVVETWKRLFDLDTTETPVPLRMTGFLSGHQRDDHRSWIDFHDGVNNLRREERAAAITIKPRSDAGWTTGGSYMALVRIAIDLAAWRRLQPDQQEQLVGRDKLTGAPLVPGRDGVPQIAPGFVTKGGADVLDPANVAFREQRFPQPIPYSHIDRATNHRRQYPEFTTSARIFRQSYEFLERIDVPPFFRAGLNFISFQDTPERLHTILSRDGWLGGFNFGGPPGEAPAGRWLLSVRAAGIFLVPPLAEAESFPGSSIFGLSTDRPAVSSEVPTSPPG